MVTAPSLWVVRDVAYNLPQGLSNTISNPTCSSKNSSDLLLVWIEYMKNTV